MKRFKTADFIRIVVIVSAVALCVWLGIKFYPFLDGIITKQSVRDEFRDYLRAGGIKGVVVFLLVELAQMIMLLPDTPVNVLAGMAWGAIPGTAICFAGALVGTALIFLFVRTLSNLFVTDSMRETVSKYRFLQNEQRIYGAVFFIFLIPGTPKDLLTYISPLLPVNTLKLLAVTLCARLPLLTITSVAGAKLQQGEFAQGILLFVILAAAGIVGFAINELIIRKKNKDRATADVETE